MEDEDFEGKERLFALAATAGAMAGFALGFHWVGSTVALLGVFVGAMVGIFIGGVLVVLWPVVRSEQFVYLIGSAVFWAMVIVLWKA